MLYEYGHLPPAKNIYTLQKNMLRKKIQNVYIWSPLS